MTVRTSVTCDGCGADLTWTGNSIDWRLALLNETIPHRGSACTDMMIYPAIERDTHFCRLPCLQDWLGRQEIQRHRDWNYHRYKQFAP